VWGRKILGTGLGVSLERVRTGFVGFSDFGKEFRFGLREPESKILV